MTNSLSIKMQNGKRHKMIVTREEVAVNCGRCKLLMGPTRGGVVNTSRMLKTFDNILLKRGVVATVDTSKTFKPVVYCLKDKQQHSTPFFTQKSNVYKYIQIYLQTTNTGHFAYFTQQDIKDHKFQTTNLQITSRK